jgi:hypothetical protein
MAKPDFKEILLQKGDKIALIAGGAIAALLAILGVISFAQAESPTGTVTKFKSATENVKRRLTQEGEPAPTLPVWVEKGSTNKQLPMDAFALVGKPFEPIHQPDKARSNPQVMPIIASQVDLVRGPMRSLDMYIEGTGNERVVRIGVLKEKKKLGDENLASKAVSDAALRRVKSGTNSTSTTGQMRRPGQSAPGAGMPGGPGAGMPGGPGAGMPGGPGAGMPGGPGAGMPGGPGAGMPGGPGAGGGGRSGDDGEGNFGGMAGMGGGRGGMPGGPGMGGFQSAARSDLAVEYATPDEIEKKGLQMAETVYPLRAVLVHAVFPLKEQLEELRRALKARDINEAIAMSNGLLNGVPTAGPIFRGFEVERRRVARDGTPLDEWSIFDHENEYAKEINPRSVSHAPDAGEIAYFMKPGADSYTQRLMAPLPALADNLAEYPRIRISQIQDAIKKLRDMGKQPTTISEWQRNRRIQPVCPDDSGWLEWNRRSWRPQR